MENFSGQRVGTYEFRGKLGAGAMGTVYRAYQTSMKREVAIKVLPEELADNADYIARFNREAETLTKLEHPHIVPIYDYGMVNGVPYVVMRLLTGGSLTQRLTQKGIPTITETRQVIQHIASALDYAHHHGVIHRDIKSSNVMFDGQGNAYLTDFGIARLLQATTGLTATGMAMGTPSYMAPEQWKGQDATPQTDIYAMGVLLYAMVTGRLPFEAPTPYALMEKHINEMPLAPSELRSEISNDLTGVIEKALAKSPKNRFQSGSELVTALNHATKDIAAESPSGFLTDPITLKSPTQGGTGSFGRIISTEVKVARWRRGGMVAAVTLTIMVVVVGLFLAFGRDQNSTANENTVPTSSGSGGIVAVAPTNTLPLIEILPTATQTGTNTRTPTSTRTPSITPTFTDSPTPTSANVYTEIARIDQVTADALGVIQTMTATLWTPSNTPNVTASIVAVRTEFAQATAIAQANNLTATADAFTDTPTTTLTTTPSLTPTATFSLTPTITFTPSDTPTPLPPTSTPTASPTLTTTPSPTPLVLAANGLSGLRAESRQSSFNQIADVNFDPSGRYIVLSGDSSNQIEVWDRDKGFAPNLPLFTDNRVIDAAVSTDGTSLAVVTYSTSGETTPFIFRDYATALNPESEKLSTPDTLVYSVAFSTDDLFLYGSGEGGRLYKWSINDLTIPPTMFRPATTDFYVIRDVFSDNGQDYLVLSKSTFIEIRGTDDRYTLAFQGVMPKNIRSVAYSHTFRLLAVTDTDGNFYVWHFGEGKVGTAANIVYRENRTSRQRDQVVVDIHPTQPIIVEMVRNDQIFEFMDFSDARKPVTIDLVTIPYAGNENTLLFSPDGRYLIRAFTDTFDIFSVPWYWQELASNADPQYSQVLTGSVGGSEMINVRSLPDQASEILGQLGPSDNLQIIARNSSGTWVQIVFESRLGWVFAGLINVNGEISSLPEASQEVGVEGGEITWEGVIEDLSANFGITDVIALLGNGQTQYSYTSDDASVGFDQVLGFSLTDAEGSFQINNIPGSAYFGMAYSFYHQMPYGPQPLWFDPTDPDQKISSNIYLLPNPTVVTPSIRLIALASGSPLDQQNVRIYRMDTMELVGEITTNEDGFIPEMVLIQGPYLIVAESSSKLYHARIYVKDGMTNLVTLTPLEPADITVDESGKIIVLIGLDDTQNATCLQYYAHVFDLNDSSRLVTETSDTGRLLVEFDPSNTSGVYVIRYDAFCRRTSNIYVRRIAYSVLEFDPNSSGQITLTETLVPIPIDK